MDPQVYGELLTQHRKGNKDDVEALNDRFPLQEGAGKASKWDHGRRETCEGGKVYQVAL